MIVVFILVFVATFFVMEFVAWATHKFVMHGFLWNLHQDHHQVTPHFFEKNDFFFLIFAIPSWLCIMLGIMYQKEISVCIGFGIAFYGLIYFLIHEVYIHRRFKWLRNLEHPYFIALRKAHKAHHKNQGKADSECFGMLIVPRKFYKEAKETYRKSHSSV